MLKTVILIAALSALVVSSATGQSTKSPFYLSMGIGTGDDGRTEGSYFSFGLVGTVKQGHLVYSARIIHNTELHLITIMGSAGPAEFTSDIALLVGFSTKATEGSSATLEVGPGLVRQSGYSLLGEEQAQHTIGLAMQSQMFFKRIGMTLFADVNGRSSFIGMLFCFRFGRCS